MRDVAAGMAFLHGAKKPIPHGSLKPSAILLDDRLGAKVAWRGLVESPIASIPYLGPNKGTDFIRHVSIASVFGDIPRWSQRAAKQARLRGKDRDLDLRLADDVHAFGKILLR